MKSAPVSIAGFSKPDADFMADKKKKPQRLKARLPRGFVDRSPDDIRATNKMVAAITEVYEKYGFDPVETPLFEYTDALGKFLPDSDRPNEGVFSLQDDDEQWMSLRYDLTAPLARHVAENFNEIQLPYRTWRAGWVFRNEKPGPGRFRQFMQLDADSIGAPGVQADAEMCMMMADTMEALGIARGDYVIRVNNRKVLDGYMTKTGLGGEHNAGKRLTVLRAIDKRDRLGDDGVKELMGDGRLDESGDWTPGAGLNSDQIEVFFDVMLSSSMLHYEPADQAGYDTGFVKIDGQPWVADYFGLRRLADDLSTTDTGSDGAQQLIQMANIFDRCGYRDRIDIDPSVVRGLEYYTGPVYEAEMLAEIPNEKGEIVQFGSVGGGGRYDGLVSRFMGQPVPATGFSIGVSRLMTALKNLGKLDTSDVIAPVLVTVMDSDHIGEYMRITKLLRDGLNPLDDNGKPIGPTIPVEMYQGNPKKFGNQLKYADRRGCPIAIIQGSDERERGIVQFKDMIEGRRQAEAIASNEEWREQRPGQFEADEANLIETVQKLLGEQAADRKSEL